MDANAITTSEVNTDTLTAADLNATLTFADGDLLDLDAINLSGTGEGLLLPQSTTCASGTAEGQLCWDTDNENLYVGTSAGSQLVGGASGAGDVTDVGSCATGACFTDGLASAATPQLVVEGTTVDTNEFFLNFPANVGADVTVTLPSTTGTVVTTGDTDTVSSTMITDSTVASADIALDTIVAADIATGAVATAELLDDTITATDLNATLTFADADLLDLDAINMSSTTEGLLLPQSTTCASGTAEGQLCWDTDNDLLYIGNAASAARSPIPSGPPSTIPR